jgi:hypothetical protein
MPHHLYWHLSLVESSPVLLQLIDPVKSVTTRLARELVFLGQMGGHVRLDGRLGLVTFAAVVAAKRAVIRVRAQVGQQQALVFASVTTHVALVEGTMLGLMVPLHGSDFVEGGATCVARALSQKRLPVVVQPLVHLHQVAAQPVQRTASALERGHQGVLASHVPCHATQGAFQSAA